MTTQELSLPTGASMNRHGSKQDYETPADFILAVEKRFGRLDFDLAASVANAKTPRFFTKEDDALTLPWNFVTGNLWLNPPFSNIEPWARKCQFTLTGRQHARHILLLTPASVGSNWFADYVFPSARVFALRPRLQFVGAKDPYPKDLILSVFGLEPGFELWKWK